jgi:hypothetical protein
MGGILLTGVGLFRRVRKRESNTPKGGVRQTVKSTTHAGVAMTYMGVEHARDASFTSTWRTESGRAMVVLTCYLFLSLPHRAAPPGTHDDFTDEPEKMSAIVDEESFETRVKLLRVATQVRAQQQCIHNSAATAQQQCSNTAATVLRNSAAAVE